MPELFLPHSMQPIALGTSHTHQAAYRTVLHVNYAHIALLAVVVLVCVGGAVMFFRPRWTSRD